MENLFSVSIC